MQSFVLFESSCIPARRLHGTLQSILSGTPKGAYARFKINQLRSSSEVKTGSRSVVQTSCLRQSSQPALLAFQSDYEDPSVGKTPEISGRRSTLFSSCHSVEPQSKEYTETTMLTVLGQRSHEMVWVRTLACAQPRRRSQSASFPHNNKFQNLWNLSKCVKKEKCKGFSTFQ